MPISSIGLVVSGETDKLALIEIAKKYLPSGNVQGLTTDGHVKKKLITRLKTFQYSGQIYDRVIIVDDSDGKDPEVERQLLINVVGSKTFPFELRYVVICQELEAWFLADETALTKMSVARGGRPIQKINGTLEEVQSPKEVLIKLLNQADIPSYTPEIARQIAEQLDTNKILSRCPRYNEFENALR
jgi:hypothetical protein